MKKALADCDFDPNSVPLDKARGYVLDAVKPVVESEPCPTWHARGRVLATAVQSKIDVPAYTNSAMDGYAFGFPKTPADPAASYTLVDTVMAGKPIDRNLQPGQCVRIMTGAPLPKGADTVVMQEHVEVDGTTVCFDLARLRSGANVRHAGEDILLGQTVLPTGHQLSAADQGLLASLGIDQIPVLRRPKVAIMSTGDEIKTPGEPLQAGQIYDSNRFCLHGLLQSVGVEVLDFGIIADDAGAIDRVLRQAASEADVIISSGGVSVGDADYVKTVLEALGTMLFWKIAMKPGRPFAFGKIQSSWFFGLPGNPVSVMATFYQLVLPALYIIKGTEPPPEIRLQARCTSKLIKRPGRIDYQRGILGRDDQGRLEVRSTGMQGSHVLTSMSNANCFIILPEQAGDIEAGNWVEVQPFATLMK